MSEIVVIPDGSVQVINYARLAECVADAGHNLQLIREDSAAAVFERIIVPSKDTDFGLIGHGSGAQTAIELASQISCRQLLVCSPAVNWTLQSHTNNLITARARVPDRAVISRVAEGHEQRCFATYTAMMLGATMLRVASKEELDDPYLEAIVQKLS